MKIQVNSQGKAYKSGNKFLKPTSFSGNGEFLVMVIDYDGTVLKQDYLNTGDVFTMPTPPTHKGLVFQEWSAPLQIVNNTVTVGIDDCIIGAVYTTESGKNEFDITLNSLTGLEFTLKMNGTKDWGDGTSDTETTHTYSQEGDYTITCDGTTIQNQVFGQTSSAYNCSVTAVRLAHITNTSSSYTFAYMRSLKTITIPKGYRGLVIAWFYGCSAQYIILPTTVSTNIGSNVFRGATRLKIAVIPYGVISTATSFRGSYSLLYGIMPSTKTGTTGSYFLAGCYGIQKRIVSYASNLGEYFLSASVGVEKVVCINNVTDVGAAAFNACTSLMEVDFTHNTSVPTLDNVNAFTEINPLCKIKVPASLETDWKEATNWATYADHIVGV